MGRSKGENGEMRAFLLVAVVAVMASAVYTEAPEDSETDLQDLGDLGEGFDPTNVADVVNADSQEENSNKIRKLGEELVSDGDQTTKIETNDTLTAECYVNTLDDAKKHCNSKTSKKQCDGSMADWYCDPSTMLVCEIGEKLAAENKYQCRKPIVGALDQIVPSRCCKWDASADPKCTFDSTKSSADFNKCENMGSDSEE